MLAKAHGRVYRAVTSCRDAVDHRLLPRRCEQCRMAAPFATRGPRAAFRNPILTVYYLRRRATMIYMVMETSRAQLDADSSAGSSPVSLRDSGTDHVRTQSAHAWAGAPRLNRKIMSGKMTRRRTHLSAGFGMQTRSCRATRGNTALTMAGDVHSLLHCRPSNGASCRVTVTWIDDRDITVSVLVFTKHRGSKTILAQTLLEFRKSTSGTPGVWNEVVTDVPRLLRRD